MMGYSYQAVSSHMSLQLLSILCLMVLYAGFIVNIPTLPEALWFIRDFSMFYWGCNVLYYNDIGNS